MNYLGIRKKVEPAIALLCSFRYSCLYTKVSSADKYAALRKDSDDLLDDMFGPDLSAADDLTLPSTFDSSSGDKSFLPADLLDTDLYGLSLQGTILGYNLSYPIVFNHSTHVWCYCACRQ